MIDFFYLYYGWFKVLHIISVISWMASLLYLPRLFVYHALEKHNSSSYKTFLIMESRLIRIILVPSMVVTFISGLMLSILYGVSDLSLSFYIKFSNIILLIILSIFFIKCHIKFILLVNKKTSNFFRVINEFPTIFMIISIIMVVIKPF